MPAYNAEKFIAEAINSVIRQSYKNWELIIVDDLSIDNTRNIINSFVFRDIRIKPIFLDKNGGKPSIAKNFAIKKAVGKYIAFLDSDDIWIKNKLEIQVKVMESSNGKYKLSYCGGYWIDENGYEIKSFLPKYKRGYLIKEMLSQYEINNQSVMITKQALNDTLKIFNENITIGEDFNLFMHIIYRYEIIAIKKYLIKYRIHSDAITKSKKRISDGVLITLKELNLFKKYPVYSIIAYLKAVRFKYIKKRWK